MLAHNGSQGGKGLVTRPHERQHFSCTYRDERPWRATAEK